MTPAVFATVVVGLLAAGMAFASYWLATRQLRAQADATSKTVDAEAYDRAERITSLAIDRLERQINGLQQQIDGLRTERDALRTERDALRVERDRLHDLNNRLEEEVGKLRGFRDEAARLGEANRRLEAEIERLGGHTI